MILYSFERRKRALILELKIMQIESLAQEIFTFKCKCLFQIDSKCVERIITEPMIQSMRFLALWIDLILPFQVNINSFF